MKHYAVIGCPIAQSRSPEIYGELFSRFGIDADFKRLLVTPDMLPYVESITADLNGFAVTMPLKRSIIPYLDRTDVSAACGSVNIVKRENDLLAGYNTDGAGLVMALSELGFDPNGKRAAIYGRGGAALAAAYALADRGAEVDLLVRTTEKRADDPSARFECGLFDSYSKSCDVFINATPLGMPGMPGFAAFDFIQKLSPQVIFDMVYLPSGETELVEHARGLGITAASGFSMLYCQALLAFEIWCGIPAAALKRCPE